MCLEDNGHTVLPHQRVQGQFPVGSPLVKLPLSRTVVAAPLVLRGQFDPAAACTEHMVHEDKLVPCVALLERGLQPGVLGIADG